MKVSYFQRKLYADNCSIERVFSDVRRALPPEVHWEVLPSKYPSRGIFRRLFNSVEAAFRQGDINHITGDVHFLAWFMRRNSTVLTVHDCGRLVQCDGFRRMLLRLLWFTIPSRRCALITAVSEFTKSELIRNTGCIAQKIRVIHNPLSSGFLPSPRLFNTSCPVILFVGVRPNKNLERSAAALRGIACHLEIIGAISASQRDALETNGVHYATKTGLTDDEIIGEYRNCDLLLFPSIYEGFGLPIIEAQATGRPVIAGNVCSIPEVAGDGACLVDPFDTVSIREGVIRVIQDAEYRQRLTENGFRNVSRFSPEAVAAQYLQVYEQILAQSFNGVI